MNRDSTVKLLEALKATKIKRVAELRSAEIAVAMTEVVAKVRAGCWYRCFTSGTRRGCAIEPKLFSSRADHLQIIPTVHDLDLSRQIYHILPVLYDLQQRMLPGGPSKSAWYIYYGGQ